MATSIPATCDTVNQALLSESGRLGGRMFQRIARRRPLIRLLSRNRGAFMNGMGASYSSVTFERSFPALTGDDWQTIAVSDGADVNACLPPTETVTFGQTSRSITPKHKAINTEDFCIRDIQFAWQYVQWLNLVSTALDRITEWVWWRRYVQDYFTAAGHKLTLSVASGTQDHATAYNTSNLPTSTLSQGVLDSIAGSVWREGGDNMEYYDKGTGGAVGTVILSPEASDQILRSNPEFRTDVRYATMGQGNSAILMPGFPTERRVYGGYVHEIEPFPRRFKFSGGAYVEVAPFIASGTTKGNKWEQNAEYTTAPFEEAIVFHQNVLQQLAVNTAENMPADWKFSPRDWMGSFSWRNIMHKTCNPDGTIGFFRALFASAFKTIDPSVGYVILFSRCGMPLNLHSCYTS